ncbi:hypothetical protein CAPTEDRAFT_203671, partial [Capitella teleta]
MTIGLWYFINRSAELFRLFILRLTSFIGFVEPEQEAVTSSLAVSEVTFVTVHTALYSGMHSLGSSSTGFSPNPSSTKVNRKPSFEEKYHQQSSPGNSENSSVRSDSPGIMGQQQRDHLNCVAQTNGPSLDMRNTPPPPVPPRRQAFRGSQTPPPMSCSDEQQEQVMTPPGHVQQMIKKMSMPPTAMQRDISQMRPAASSATCSVTPHRGMSPVLGRHSVLPQNQPQALYSAYQSYQQYLQTKIPNGGSGGSSGSSSPAAQQSPSPAPYPSLPYNAPPSSGRPPMPSPTLSNQSSEQYYHYFGDDSSSLSSQSPIPASTTGLNSQPQGISLRQMPQPVPAHAWSTRPCAIYKQEVHSRKVQKPVPQTATAPMSPPQMQQQQPQQFMEPLCYSESELQRNNYVSSVQAQYSGQYQIQNQQANSRAAYAQQFYTPSSTPRSESPVPRNCWNHSPQSVISTTSTPSTNSDIPDKPPPPYPGLGVG